MENRTDTLSLYVHIPFCRSKCRYCAFYSEPVAQHDTTAFVDALIIEIHRCPLAENVRTVYIGGGTPTSLGHDNLVRLANEITRRCTRITEFTVEANPHHLDRRLLDSLRQAGPNRLSVGAQSFNPDELALLGRTHSPRHITAAVKNAKQAGFGNIGLDLIFAIPNSTLDSWQNSLQTAIELDVQHISAYALTWEPDTPLDDARKTGDVTPVDEETDRQMYLLAIEKLAQANLPRYEISNFAPEPFRCLHNLAYWANDPFIGIGPAAASYYLGQRSTNIANVARYLKRIQAGQSPAEQTETSTPLETACQTAVLNLRTSDGIDLRQFQKRTGYDLTRLFPAEIRENIKLGLLQKTKDRIRLTPRALPIADTVCADFAHVSP